MIVECKGKSIYFGEEYIVFWGLFNKKIDINYNDIKKIEFKDGYLTFTAEKPELDVWSEVFSIHQGLSFKRGEGCQVIARILRPADALDFSLKVIKSIYECKNEETING